MLQECKLRHLIASSRAVELRGTQRSEDCSRFYLASYMLSLCSLTMLKEPGLDTNLQLGKPISSSINKEGKNIFYLPSFKKNSEKIQINFWFGFLATAFIRQNTIYKNRSKGTHSSHHWLYCLQAKDLGVVLKKLNKFHVPEKFLLSLLSTWHMSLSFKRTKFQNNLILQTKQAILYISCELLSHCPITLFPFILKLLKMKSPVTSFFHNPNPINLQVPY